ncbi:MAG: pirin family protein [Myxococcales bacterium]|nr:MAG: pirin family protein [Myxococcales bacterium]
MTNSSHEPIATTPTARPGARTVAGVYRATTPHWVGDAFHVSSYFPRPGLSASRTSPFLLMDYGPPREFAPSSHRRGVGWHPHRGFETVTLAWEGEVAHTDNAGHSGVIGPGDVQWMTAAGGILHQEYLSEAFSRQGGRMHMMQLWVNLPRKDKMSPPGYQPITAAQIPTVQLADGAGSVRVVAGEFGDARGPARTFTPLSLLDATLTAGGQLTVPLPAHHTAMAIVTRGHVSSDGKEARAGELLLFAGDGARLELTAAEDTHLLVLTGEPIDEPIVQHGPFVMNSTEEIYQAMHDFNDGKFGSLPE